MKVASQILADYEHSRESPTTGSNQASEDDFRKLCELQIEQLTVGLYQPVAVWIVYQDLSTVKRVVVNNKTNNYIFKEELSFRQQENWIPEDLPVLKLVKLTFSDIEYVYVCCLGEYSSQAAEYVGLCTSKPLTPEQQQLVLASAQLLSQYLVMYRQIHRQTAEISALAQALGRAEHQLRHPLALINLLAENLRLTLPSGSLQEGAALIRETVDELSQNLTNLLYCGQRAQQRIGQYDLQTILAESIQALQPWRSQKQLQISYPQESVTVAVDRWQMKQVFDNLLSNAMQFSPPGETVTCNWQVYRHEVLVTICNRGCGISEADLQQIFNPYFSRRPGGTGLGLAIAQKIILDHQGSLWVENLREGGVQFSFTLPLPKPS